MKRLIFTLVILFCIFALLLAPTRVSPALTQPCLAQTLRRVKVGGAVKVGQQAAAPASSSYVGNSDPGLLITSVSLSNLRTTAAGFSLSGLYYLGFGFWSLTSDKVPAVMRGVCRMKVAGSSRQHYCYIIDDIDPCGNIQREATVDMAVGSDGDWVCSDFSSPWDPGTFGVSYNVLCEEHDSQDPYYWEETSITGLHTEWIYPGNTTWTTYSPEAPGCLTLAGNAGTNHEFGPVNLIINNPATAGNPQ